MATAAGTTAGTTGPRSDDRLNLVDLFRYADDVTAIHGDTPGETVAIIEWLLGLLYAAGEHRLATDDQWLAQVTADRPLAPVADWLEGHDGCWDLFDPEQPLGQNADLRPHLDAFGVGPAQLFIERAGDYNQHFDHHHLHHPAPVPADAAFRAMLTQHVYGLGGRAMIKAKDMGLPAAFTNNAVCRLGTRVRVLALGRTLGDTLRLNLAPWQDTDPGPLNLTWTTGERRTFRASGTREARVPAGPADLHTVLGRSVLMRPAAQPDGGIAVDRVLLGPGETLGDLPSAYLPDAIAYEKAGKRTLFRPSATRELWRESHALYAAVAERTAGASLYGRLAMLRGRRRIDLWAVGIVANKTKVTSWVSDQFPYVPGREVELRFAAADGSAVCEYTAKALYAAACVARDIAYPNPKPADKPAQLARFNAEPEMWAAAAPAFHTLLEAVADNEPAAQALTEFGGGIRRLAVTALNERLDSLPPSSQGLQARVRAQERLQKLLDSPKAPPHLKDASDD
ncbi:type I-E CRISPR-associated protein Cse1/CasA [Kitasatospora kifunensis]|uniref:CRISPR system Cascade subunit CasA n=1 Tax=Kitasatospora kifunensis TaxID=58351 RepID=A0A7W7RBC9_KITKI|nr:type I-E CRISPR-associated protein Cse1/CasA [Kitasatospora kifunensis]MBB4928851.1 CRISPR system Cascade subunit CasA [Kitasatospora kifunensis]